MNLLLKKFIAGVAMASLSLVAVPVFANDTIQCELVETMNQVEHLSDEDIATKGASEPNNPWTLTNGDYDFSYNVNYTTVFSNYYFTGVKSITVSIDDFSNVNPGDIDSFTVELRSKSSGALVESKTIKRGGSGSFTVNNLKTDGKYFVKINKANDGTTIKGSGTVSGK